MTIALLRSVIATGLILGAFGVARANDQRSVCRWTGIGCSDGYHSHYGCPPKPCAVVRHAPPAPAAKQKPIPWWMIPADGAEEMPAPSADTSPPTYGQSLFRQPGEGSSVSAPTIRR